MSRISRGSRAACAATVLSFLAACGSDDSAAPGTDGLGASDGGSSADGGSTSSDGSTSNDSGGGGDSGTIAPDGGTIGDAGNPNGSCTGGGPPRGEAGA